MSESSGPPPSTDVGDDVIVELFAAARDVRARSYSPYSGYRVGAAVRTTTGAVFACCNVENAAYPEGVCAEAGAISMMVAGTSGPPAITDVVTVTAGESPGSPCGGCRQKIREFSGTRTRVHLANENGVVRTMTLDDLLPASFGPDDLL